ncbi:glycosyltransferase family 2 protein [Clostridium vincentii]|uniref:Poly-beta-1,6-N-acetyl-D-glucosamine synthase n=1 Tax=Clostridium vincentii TaxID=52704 RepID=A0A2T0BCR0_9CLOT|nr:glycosyltransferase family 2 protein [Clostridium vincentii]PRR81690.1 Poly-beta-1,6-N-acetyl-D-glucosamine synthase [Clostridium vincentii]
MNILVDIISGYSKVLLVYFFVISIVYIILIILSSRQLRDFIKTINNDVTIISKYTKPISIIVPAYDEEVTIIDNITCLLELDYPEFEIIVVNDGSNDNTLSKIIEYFKLREIDANINMKVKCQKIKGVYSSFATSNLVLIDKENGGKSDALNARINISRYPLFCGVDADCIIEKDALLRIVKPFLKYEKTIAVGGIVRIANGSTIRDGKLVKTKLPKELIVKFQIIEYFRAFLTSRIEWERINALLIVSGAFGVFKKSAVMKVGGYSATIGEDMELTLKMHEYFRKNKIKYKIDFASDAVCWTQSPNTLKGLKSQRIRWHRGLTDSFLRHRKMIFNPKYGAVGLLAVPYFILVEMLGPIIESIGYIMLIVSIITGTLSRFSIIIFLMAFLYGILFSLAAILSEQFSYKKYSNVKEITELVINSFFEQFIYRQITVWWRVTSFFNFKKGSKQWGTIKRNVFDKEI